MRKIPALKDVLPQLAPCPPRVSILIPARNEASKIEKALQSVLLQDYPNFEVIAINDRSTDQTGNMLDRHALQHAHLSVIHIVDLPPGWIGKNYALYKGSQHATGEIFLFTDADIVMRPDVLSRAVTYLQKHKSDHLTLSPENNHRGIFLPLFSTYFFLCLFIYLKPWKVQNPNSRRYIGIGAFNLIRKEAYRVIGGHETLRLQVVDDLMLGKIVKRAGFHQVFLFGTNTISVEWYASLHEMVNGLQKNMFAGMKFSIAFVLASTIGTCVGILWPFIAIWATDGLTRYLNLITIFCMLWHYQAIAGRTNQKRIYALVYPIAAALLSLVQIRSMLTTLRQNGITWRETHYPLSELKKHRIKRRSEKHSERPNHRAV